MYLHFQPQNLNSLLHACDVMLGYGLDHEKVY